MKTVKFLYLSICFLLMGCFGLWDSGSDTITGDYSIIWIDVFENQSICRKLEGSSGGWEVLVPEYVFAVGHNDDYIIAKQHPTSGFEGDYKIDTNITNYYIIAMNKKNRVLGPMSYQKFEQLRAILNIRDIDFDQVYPHVP